jgi:hypothetical protein
VRGERWLFVVLMVKTFFSYTLYLDSSHICSCMKLARIELTRGHRGRDRMVVDLQLPVQSVPITTKVVSLNPVHGEMYSIQHYVIKFDSDFQQVGGFLRVFWYNTRYN